MRGMEVERAETYQGAVAPYAKLHGIALHFKSRFLGEGCYELRTSAAILLGGCGAAARRRGNGSRFSVNIPLRSERHAATPP